MTHTTNLTAKAHDNPDEDGWMILDPDSWIVGEAYYHRHDGAYVDAKANARLWAAGGDLLAALLEVEWVEIPGDGFMLIDVCPWCNTRKENGHSEDCSRQAAIAKARGERCES